MSRITSRSMPLPRVGDSLNSRPMSVVPKRLSPPTVVTKDSPSISWTRPTDWLVLNPVAATEVCFLYGVWAGDANYLAFTVTTSSGNFTVDWGDSTSNSYASGTLVEKQILWSSYSNVTARGYRQAIIRITGNIQTVNFDKRHSSRAVISSGDTQILECKAQGAGITRIVFYDDDNQTRSSSLESFEFIGTCNLTDCYGMFLQCARLENVVFPNLNSVIYMDFMFQDCISLKKIELLGTSSCTYMDTMFERCRSLVSVKIPETALAGSTNRMFNGCTSLVDVQIGHPISSTNCSDMFKNCEALQYLPPLRTPSATNMANMFNTCYALEECVLPETGAVTNMNNMFNYCLSLKKVVIPQTSSVTDMSFMFYYCQVLSDINIGPLTSVVDMSYMFYSNCAIEEFTVTACPNATTIESIFDSCASLKSVRFEDISSVTNLNYSFWYCKSLRKVTWPSVSSGTEFRYTFRNCHSLQEAPIIDPTSIDSMQNMFESSGVKSVEIDTNGTFDLGIFQMFYNCFLLEKVSFTNLSGFPIIPGDQIFANCYNLKTISGLKISSFYTMNNTFTNCASLQQILDSDIRTSHDLSNCNFSSSALNAYYTALATVTGGQTLTVTGNPGTSSDDPSIATAKGWTVVG